MHTPVSVTDVEQIDPVRVDDPDGIAMIRHSSAHVMADAVQQLFPGTKVTIGPSTAHGFYDFDKLGAPFSETDSKPSKRHARHHRRQTCFRREIVRRQRLELFDGMGESYARDHRRHRPRRGHSLYRHGAGFEWVDLCAGPHVPNTGTFVPSSS